MHYRFKIIFLISALTFGIWITDVYLDSIVLTEHSFLELLKLHVTALEGALFAFIVLGLIVAASFILKVMERDRKNELQSYNAILQSLIDSTDDATLISDKYALPVLWNKAYARIMKEALNIDMRKGLQPHKQLTDEKSIAWWDNLHKRVLSGESFRVEYSHEFGKDDIRHYEISYNAIFEDGEVSGFSEFTRDITERKKMEEAIKNSEENYRNIIENATFGICIYDESGQCIVANKAMADIIGATVEQMLSQNFYAIKSWQKSGMLDSAKKSLETGKNQRRTAYVVTTFGKEIWLDYALVPYSEEEGKFLMFFTQDVTGAKRAEEELIEVHSDLEKRVQERTTELEKANEELQFEIETRIKTEENLISNEKRFRAAATTTADLIWEGDVRADILIWHGDIDTILGYEQNEFPHTISGHMDSIHPDDRDKLIQAVEKAIESGDDFEAEYRIRCKNGDYRFWNERGRVVEFEDGKAVKWVGSVTDITDRVCMEKEARLVQSRLIHANKMTSLGTLVSGVAHEINNPNSYIMSNAQVFSEIWSDAVKILEENQNGKNNLVLGGIPFNELIQLAPRLLDGINDGSVRINTIIQNLKNFARPDKSSLDGKVDIKNVIMSSRAILVNHINKLTDNFHVELEDAIPVLRGSSQQIEQVIINLIMNAMQALTDKDSEIRISAYFDKIHGNVVIKVKDEGRGMSDDIIGSVTEPFFTTRSDEGGTGLGLSISYTIVKDHNGTIEFESELGSGTTVTITLPVSN